jgi:uncharacterized sulfatase
LYDLKKDKSEMHNVYGSKGYVKIAQQLKKQLDGLIDQYEDTDAEKILKSNVVDQKSF